MSPHYYMNIGPTSGSTFYSHSRMLARILKTMYRTAMCISRLRTVLLVFVAGIIMFFLYLVISFVLQFTSKKCEAEFYSSPWHYQCDNGMCQKSLRPENVTNPVSLGVCQLFCGEAVSLWPKPNGHVSLGNQVSVLNPNAIFLSGANLRTKAGQLLQKNIERLKENLRKIMKTSEKKEGLPLKIIVPKEFDFKNERLTLDTPEGYTLQLYHGTSDQITAEISASSYFGARHAMETLSQLIVYDDFCGCLKIVRNVHIMDKPVFPYRGILLDTSRNFIDKKSILRTIEAMAMSKLNTFHWHITDSHSFPYFSKTLPQMSHFGAYSPDKVYKPQDIEEIVEYGLVRGVRVLPEFDAPAHVGEGWQWVGNNATVCFKAEPWLKYCVEPPCGQLNPISDKVYEILFSIYSDMIESFRPDMFHMGGDEVNINCWNSTETIKEWLEKKGWGTNDQGFYKLWQLFQTKAHDNLIKANGGEKLPAILWTSGLTDEEHIKMIDPEKYIIQIWTQATDATIERLIKNNIRVIFSNYDALYLDCGFGAWVGEGNNWCSPYKGWQKIYDNSPYKILENQGVSNYKHLVLGGEATLWSEQVDSAALDAKLWPRSAAMAERLWSDPTLSWIQAEHRFLQHRERLVQMGINADSIEPQWCLQNQGHCYL